MATEVETTAAAATEFTENCSYYNVDDEDKDFTPRQIKKMVKNKMIAAFKDNNVISYDVEYIIFRTSYTSRIVNAEKVKKNKNIIAINADPYWKEDDTKDYFNDANNGSELFSKFADSFDLKDGVVIFKNQGGNDFYINFFKNLKFLTDLDYCACCNIRNVYDISYKVVDGNKVISVYIDCESG